MPDHSPATSAIVAAFDARYELCGPFDDNWQELCLAAALRALDSASYQPGSDFKQIDPARSATIRRALESLPDPQD